MSKNFVNIARVVPEISSRTGRQTDTHTHRRTHHNTSQPLPRAKLQYSVPYTPRVSASIISTVRPCVHNFTLLQVEIFNILRIPSRGYINSYLTVTLHVNRWIYYCVRPIQPTGTEPAHQLRIQKIQHRLHNQFDSSIDNERLHYFPICFNGVHSRILP